MGRYREGVAVISSMHVCPRMIGCDGLHSTPQTAEGASSFAPIWLKRL